MKKLIAIIACGAGLVSVVEGQVLLSGGLTYSQNFDTLATSTTTAQPAWTDNSTLTGWYVRRARTVSGGTLGSFTYPTIRLDNGGANNGSVYDYGSFGSTDRALGSIGSGTISTNAIGVEIRNDTASAVSLDSISYNGEQWRVGQGNTNSAATINILRFAYQVSSSPITDPRPDIGNGDGGWVPFAGLNFTNNTIATSSTDPGGPIDGNVHTTAISSSLTGIILNPGDEVFLRWLDPDETGNDMGLAIDDFTANFSEVPEPSAAVLGGLGLLAFGFWRRRSKM